MAIHKTGKPKAFRNAQKKFGQVPINTEEFEHKIFGWQSKGFRNKDEYLKLKLSADAQDIFLIDIEPLETLPNGEMKISLLDSQSRMDPSDLADEVQRVDSEFFPRFETLTRMPHDRRIMFFTFTNPNGNPENNGYIEDTAVFTPYEILEKRHANRSFKLTEMTLQNAIGLTGKNASGQYVENVFVKDPAGAEAANQIEIIFESFTFISQIQVYDKDTGNPITLSIDNHDDLDSIFVEPKVNRNNVVFTSKEIGEMRMMKETYRQRSLIGGSATFRNYVKKTNDSGWLDMPAGKINAERCIPNTDYVIMDHTPGTIGNGFQEIFYLGDQDYFGFTPDNGLSEYGYSYRLHKYSDIGWAEAPWESHNGKYVSDLIAIINAGADNKIDSLAMSDIVLNPNMNWDAYRTFKNELINGAGTWNSIDYLEKFDNPLTTIEKPEEFKDLDPSNPAHRSYKVLTFADTYELMTILENVDGALGGFTYKTDFIFNNHSGVISNQRKFKYPETTGVIQTDFPMDAFMSKSYCESKGFPTMNKITLNLEAEYGISQIKILAYGGQKIHIRQLLNGEDAVPELIFDAPSIRGSADSTLLNITFSLPNPLLNGEMTIEELLEKNYKNAKITD